MASHYKVETSGKLSEKNGLKGVQLVQFECPSTQRTLSHSFMELGDFPFPTISPQASWVQVKGETDGKLFEENGLKGPG